MDSGNKKRPSLRIKDIEKPTEKDLKASALSPSTPSGIAAVLLSDSLFPPKKPKGAAAMRDSDSDTEEPLSDEADEKSKKDPLATQVWRLYTKAKDTLPNASRMENLTWRMMAMTLNKNKSKSSAPSTPSSEKENDAEDSKMYVDSSSTPEPSAAASPPAPDDTTELLSSSAPPYMIDFFSGGPPFQRSGMVSPGATTPRQSRHLSQPRNKCVFVYGSTRATTSSSQVSTPNASV